VTPLEKIRVLFAEEKRPAHFTPFEHCEECAAESTKAAARGG
jgi:hypothetical protein